MFKKIFSSRIFIYFFSATWAVAVAVPIGYLMGFHQPLKSNVSEELLREKSLSRKSVLHLIGANCQCSVKVVEHLVKRTPLKNIPEKIIIVGENLLLSNQLKKAGFIVESIQTEVAYKKYAINVLPQMIIYESNNIAYSGGYSNIRSPASDVDFADLSIIKEFIKGNKSEALPIYGCANGKNNQQKVDPLKLKYQQ